MSIFLSDSQREMFWTSVIKMLAEYPDPNSKACIVQSAISEFGPVPDALGEAVRKAMKD